jgi:hypothetical protein
MNTRPKVLLLGREHVLHWAPLYVDAFREVCDTITCGPPLDPGDMTRQGWEHTVAYLQPHDIRTEARALEEILALLPPGWRPDLIVQVQTAMPPVEGIARAACPTAYISVDSWHDPREFQYARAFDHVFVAQRALVPFFAEAGIRCAHWLPLACSPKHHYPVDILPEHDIVFAGITFYKVNRERVARLLRLEKHFEVRMGGGLGGHGYCEALASGRVVFNSSVAQDVNMRVFEVMAIGRPLLTNRNAAPNGLTDLFTEGVHYQGYDDDDLIDQARRLLEDAALRDRLVAAARDEVLAKHTYRHRVETLLSVALPAAPSAAPLREGPKPSSWIPATTRRLGDIGLGLDKSRIALHRAGVDWVCGLTLPGQTGRAASYDHTAPWPPDASLQLDTLLCAHPLQMSLPLPELFAHAQQALPAGGELVLLLSGEEATTTGHDRTAWDTWSYARQFHLVLMRHTPGALILRFRKYTRPLLEISQDIYTRFPGGGQTRLPGEE